jgi:hypothetical protein
MADYTQDIGGNTTLMIRDLGGWVEFWVRTGAQTWNNDQQWSYFANGSASPVLKFRMVAGGGWQMMGAVYVSTDQDVRLTIYNAGLGFPTYDFWHHIQRTTVPWPPYILQTYAVSATQIYVEFTGTNDGGSVVLEWQIGYGSDPNYPQFYTGSGGASTIGGFSSGQKVYFWTRARNAVGWSGWSNRTEATTWRVPDAPSTVTYLSVAQQTVRTQFFGRGDGGQPILEYQLGYGQSSSAPVTIVGASPTGIDDTTGLDPGKLYYFWVRARNSIGWSAWSQRSQILLIAGARVLDGVTWKRAVPYVKVGGVWKVARPWVRDAGQWKESSV